MVLLQPTASTRFGIFFDQRKHLGEGAHMGFLVLVPLFPHQATFQASWINRVCGFRAPWSFLSPVGTSRRPSYWCFFCLPCGPKREWISISLLFPESLIFSLCSDYAVNNFTIILGDSLYLEERLCISHFSLCGWLSVYKYCPHDFLSFKDTSVPLSFSLGPLVWPPPCTVILVTSACGLCIWEAPRLVTFGSLKATFFTDVSLKIE